MNLQTDRGNCGTCGNGCDPGEICNDGNCELFCQSGLTDCSGGCVNLQTDRGNCGTCGNVCDPGEVCSGGNCELSCQSGLADCSGGCVNLQTDRGNCGTCGNVCDPGEVCSGGNCELSCQSGLLDCFGTCIDPLSSNTHCGAYGICEEVSAGVECDAFESCCQGVCKPLPWTPVIDAPDHFCENSTVELAVEPVFGLLDYVWEVSEGMVIEAGQGTPFVSISVGEIAGLVCVHTSTGCQSSESVCVEVEPLSRTGSISFAFTGEPVTFVVPFCADTLTIEAWGAEGGEGPCCDPGLTSPGGLGGYVRGTLAVSPLEELYVYVGGQGTHEGTPGFNGGGAGGQWGASGGGASDVRRFGQALENRVIVAGGGGGGNCGCPPHGEGGDGGGLSGGDGLSFQGWLPAGGGTQTEGGAAGTDGTAGTLGQGGSTAGNSYHIAGGGGGYYGGGGAFAAGGGGGSSYLGLLLDPVTVSGANSGNGYIMISW